MKTVILSFFLTAQSVLAAVFFVAPDGNDSNPGTQAKPFATLERARDALRATTNRDALTVVLRNGVYRQERSLEFDARDSGTASHPVTWKSAPGETARIVGGMVVPSASIKRVEEATVLNRVISPEARSRLVEINLTSLGVTDFGQIGPRGWRRPIIPAPLELIIGGQIMPIACWPKAGEAGSSIGKILDKGSMPRYEETPDRGAKFLVETDRPRLWMRNPDVWITGLFANGYADGTLQLASIAPQDTNLVFSTVQPHVYGFQSGKPWNTWRALNLLEEISQPGEWACDRATGKLYFVPPTDYVPGKTEVMISTLASPVLALHGSAHLHFENLHLECSRGDGASVQGGDAVSFSGCQFRNIGNVAVSIAAEGRNHCVENCMVCDTGTGGIKLDGGNRSTLTPGNNSVSNCEIHRFNRWNRTYCPGVAISGVGNRIANCLIYDAPGCAILLHGNNHLIENNEIHHVMEDGDDMGAFYMGRNPTEFGNVIRNNYFHDVGFGHTQSTYGIYLDDCSCGAEVYGNILVRAGRRASFLIGGGKYHKLHDNIVVDSPLAFQMDNRVQPPHKQPWYPKDFQEAWDEMKAGQPPFSTAYPELAKYWQDNPEVPADHIERNLIVNCKQLTDGKLEWGPFKDNWQTDTDPGFVNAAQNNYVLRPDAQAYLKISGFQPGNPQEAGRKAPIVP